MKSLILTAILTAFAPQTILADIVTSDTSFPWMNSPNDGARYQLSDYPNRVHVFEAWTITCTWCSSNAAQVKSMAQEFGQDTGVQFIDLGLDLNDTAYRRWIFLHRPPFPVVKDEGRAVWAALKQEDTTPQTFVVDCAGHLQGFTVGYWTESHKTTIRNAISRAKEVTCE